MKKINYGRQDINDADIEAVISVLRSDWLTQGPVVPEFEDSISKYCDVKHAVAVNSATSALHISCLALEVGKYDYVWTSPTTFVASANCALYCGAKIDFVDIDPITKNLSVRNLETKLIEAKKLGKLPKVVIPVHLNGQSCNMAEIYALSKKYGFSIIEDASHAIGGKYKSEAIGNCRYSDITVFSFHPVKIITTGEGGIAVTNNFAINKKLRLFRSHGITNSTEDMKPRPNSEIWNYQQITLGFNYRMTELQAALGMSQLSRIDEFVESRHNIANRYDKELLDLPLYTPIQHKDCYSAFHLYVVQIVQEDTSITQIELHNKMQEYNINVNLHYIPVYRQPFFEAMGFERGYCPQAEKYYKTVLSIPIYPALTDKEQGQVINALFEILN
jgi:UDP-4-amino-4,6-dideoxy-N-acetyl-beta-L-altrosamine transaminase